MTVSKKPLPVERIDGLLTDYKSLKICWVNKDCSSN